MFFLVTLIGCFLNNLITSELILIVLIIDFILIGGIIPLLERKYLSLMQRRIGPKYVGYKGRLQFIADALKLFFKEYFYVVKVDKFKYLVAPFIFFNVSTYLFINVVWNENIFYFDVEFNILFWLILSSMSHIIIFFTGYLSKNKYAVMSSNRVINIYFVNEILVTIIIFQFLLYSNSFSFSNFNNSHTMLSLFFFIQFLPLFVLLFLIEVNKVPFDYSEAESELVMGITTEYTGFIFGIYTLSEYVHLFFMSYITLIFFFL